MKKSILWIIIVVVSVALFAGAYFLYNRLSPQYAPTGFGEVNKGNSVENDIPQKEEAPDEPEQPQEESQEEEYKQAQEEVPDYTAPDFTVYDGEGNEVKLSDYVGKPIILNFWASWCPPCRSEMPHFEKAYTQNSDIQFLMVNMTSSDRESEEKAKKYIADEGYTFPVLYDTEGDAAITYGAYSLPMTILINEKGELVTYAVGALSEENLQTAVTMLKDKTYLE
ncbi:MAG: TlpA family protein disulfide reductase [Clostridia bacterium]|nr:TlpA family protein disulfide reductase [Clostridia bacterium]